MVQADPGLIQRLHCTKGQLTPLHVAVICSFYDIVSFLLDEKADCNIATVHDLVPSFSVQLL